MTFSDKLIALRKKAGWSQDELAERLNVSRQSVSKWESAQSMADIDKILQLSSLLQILLVTSVFLFPLVHCCSSGKENRSVFLR